MIKCAICEDENAIAEKIKSLIDEEDKRLFDSDIYLSAEELLAEKEEKYDVYFLDIEMGRISGIQLAKMIRKKDVNALIVFITSHTEQVYDVFEIVTFDFIIKPISKEKISKLVQKIKSYLLLAKSKFVFSYNKNMYSIVYDDILYLEKMGRKVMIYTKSGEIYQSNMNSAQIWEQLNEKMFGKLNKSCIVNLCWITSIDSECVILDNNVKLFIARDYRKTIKNEHLKFLEEQL